VTDARAGVTAAVGSAPNGGTRIVSDVGDKVRDATNDGAHRAADAKELVHEKAHDGVAALHNYRRQGLAIAATASLAIATSSAWRHAAVDAVQVRRLPPGPRLLRVWSACNQALPDNAVPIENVVIVLNAHQLERFALCGLTPKRLLPSSACRGPDRL
jgi:hypothetical protein